MFSRLVLRSGSFSPSVLHALKRSSGVVAVRCNSDSSIDKHVANWDKANKLYYSPERDVVNFPVEHQPETCPPTRMGVLPASWFTFFYEKTGVTGPYLFGAGLTTFLLSKELWIVEHGFSEFIAFWIAVGILAKKFGPGLSKHLQQMGTDFNKKHWDDPLARAKAQATAVIDSGEKAIWQLDGQKNLFAAKRENVDLQLEEKFRQRLATVHTAVKNRLDYQLDVEMAKRNFEQQHMVNWIVNNVLKGITPQQEKESITKCISDLKSLAAKA